MKRTDKQSWPRVHAHLLVREFSFPVLQLCHGTSSQAMLSTLKLLPQVTIVSIVHHPSYRAKLLLQELARNVQLIMTDPSINPLHT